MKTYEERIAAIDSHMARAFRLGRIESFQRGLDALVEPWKSLRLAIINANFRINRFVESWNAW